MDCKFQPSPVLASGRTISIPEEGCRLGHMPIELVGSFLAIDPLGPQPFSALCAFLAIFSLASWRSFKVSCESSSTPNHRVACLLKWTVLSPTWMPRALAVLALLLLLRTMASVLLVSKLAALALAHSWSLLGGDFVLPLHQPHQVVDEG